MIVSVQDGRLVLSLTRHEAQCLCKARVLQSVDVYSADNECDRILPTESVRFKTKLAQAIRATGFVGPRKDRTPRTTDAANHVPTHYANRVR